MADQGGFQFSGDDDLLTPRRYPTSQARIPTPVTRIAAEGAIGGEDSRAGGLIRCRHCTMGNGIQSTDRASWSLIFSQIFMATYPRFCSKVVVHYTIFIFVTAAMGKFLLD